MSLYNIINGYSKSCFWLLPMLDRHPDGYPRFRDCYCDGKYIIVFTRTGGPNRHMEEDMQDREHFSYTEDSEKDDTYAFYYFNVPEQWKPDFDKIISNNTREVSPEYLEQIRKVYPKLSRVIDSLLKTEDTPIEETPETTEDYI